MTMLATLLIPMLTAHASLFELPAREAPKVRPTRARWCEKLLELTPSLGTDRDRVRASLDELREGLRRRRDPRDTKGEEDPGAHHDAIRVNFHHTAEIDRVPALRRAEGRLLQLDRDLADPEVTVHAAVDVGREAILDFLARLDAGAQGLQDGSGEFTDGDPPFNRRAYVRHLRRMGLVGAMTLGFGGGAAVAVDHHAPANLIALFAGGALVSARGLYDLRRHYRRASRTREGRIRTENADVDRIDVELEALRRMEAVVASPDSYPDRVVLHGYTLHLPHSPRTFRVRRGQRALLVDFLLFEDAGGRPTLIRAVREKATRDIPRTLGNSRVVGDL